MAKPLPKPRKAQKYNVTMEITHGGNILISALSKKEAIEMADAIVNKDPMPNWSAYSATHVVSAVKADETESDKKSLCTNCGKHPITIVDYRTDNWGNTNEVYCCTYCFNLDDNWYQKVRLDNKLDPAEVLKNQ